MFWPPMSAHGHPCPSPPLLSRAVLRLRPSFLGFPFARFCVFGSTCAYALAVAGLQLSSGLGPTVRRESSAIAILLFFSIHFEHTTIHELYTSVFYEPCTVLTTPDENAIKGDAWKVEIQWISR